MSIKLKGSTDGSVTLQAPADTSPTGTDKTFTLPPQDGSSGQVLQTNGSGALSFTDNLIAPGHNLLVNGAMTVAQRGTVTGITTSKYAACDRFKTAVSSLGTWTASQVTSSPFGFSKALRLDCTTADASPAAGGYIVIMYSIEGQDVQHLNYGGSVAQDLTISFYVRSNKTGFASFEIQQKDNSDRQFVAPYTIFAANTWEKKTITIPGDSSGLINDDTGVGLRLSWWLNSGSNYSTGVPASTWEAEVNANRNSYNLGVGGSTSDYFELSGVQLEVGDKATPFDHKSYGEELQRCERYFQQWKGDGTGSTQNVICGAAGINSATSACYLVPSPKMRGPFSVEFADLIISDSATYDADVTAMGLTNPSGDGAYVTATHATNGGRSDAQSLRVKSSTNGHLRLDAEL